MLKTLTAASVAAALLAGPAAAEDLTGAALVLAKLDNATSQMDFDAGPRATGRLPRNASRTVNLRTSGGMAYILGVCDENCRTLNLIVRDSAGREIGRDVDSSTAPMVTVRGPAATYSVEVSMADCTGQCHWGVGVFRP